MIVLLHADGRISTEDDDAWFDDGRRTWTLAQELDGHWYHDDCDTLDDLCRVLKPDAAAEVRAMVGEMSMKDLRSSITAVMVACLDMARKAARDCDEDRAGDARAIAQHMVDAAEHACRDTPSDEAAEWLDDLASHMEAIKRADTRAWSRSRDAKGGRETGSGAEVRPAAAE